MELFNNLGLRKYCTPQERKKFIETAKREYREKKTFALMLAHTGVRISEALGLKMNQIDYDEGYIAIQTLKKRRDGVIRQIPVSSSFLDTLSDVHDYRRLQGRVETAEEKFWKFSRATASRYIDKVMGEAGITGIHACPKGLRHGYAIACLQKNIPLNLIQKWLGHSSIKTTAIYLNAMGEEEKDFAKRLWV